MKVSDILTLVAVLAAGASAYFAYESWQDLAGKPFDEAARAPKQFRYTKGSATTRAPLVPTRINRQDRKKTELATLEQENATLDDLTKKVAGLREDNKGLSEEILKATNEKQDLQQEIQKKNRTINDNQEQLRKYEEATAVAGNPDDLKRQVEDNVRRLNEANASLAKEKDALTLALQRKEDTENSLTAAKRKESMQTSGEMEPNFRTTVREVFSRWGFVVIEGGGSRGVNANTKLLVARGGQKIAELQVTTVEPSVAVCAIVPGSLRGDMTIAPGDLVVVAPVKAAPPTIEEVPAPGAAPAPAPAPGAPAAPAAPAPGAPAAPGAEPLPTPAPPAEAPAGF